MRQALHTPLGQSLSAADKLALHRAGMAWRFTHSELKNLIDMAADFSAWNEMPLSERLEQNFPNREAAYRHLYNDWNALKNQAKSYSGFQGRVPPEKGKKIIATTKPLPGFGRCPVASPRTRCCNLLTLDAAEGCGFDCTYCSIRYFYGSGTKGSGAIGISKNILAKLKEIELDPQKTYHIGTGQSSDSLMWGNQFGILDGLLDFAAGHPNVILEFKTKSDNIAPLLSRPIPANVISTWSLNPQVIIASEEHLTASLEARLAAARKIADKGNLVGFHFHPMVLYNLWKTDYKTIISRIIESFLPSETAMVSFGTLTYTKSVIKKIRERRMKSRILQMPLEEIEGKLSYPLEIKRTMFRFAYQAFAPWHGKVFFYLCMEENSLWPDVFGTAYSDNAEFEEDMIESYRKKIQLKT
ncbi:MAG: hypothetical protein B0D92_00400 [Spirochaeta sp. LUC14_002_19_P3]|nr:MAG: hypothetical protein B0D92_00400 [Spirochaeta sp. LUC14_002_19_P3]